MLSVTLATSLRMHNCQRWHGACLQGFRVHTSAALPQRKARSRYLRAGIDCNNAELANSAVSWQLAQPECHAAAKLTTFASMSNHLESQRNNPRASLCHRTPIHNPSRSRKSKLLPVVLGRCHSKRPPRSPSSRSKSGKLMLDTCRLLSRLI